MKLTLCQFEEIDGLMQAVLRRPALEAVMPLGRDATVAQFFRPEWRLEDAIVQALGLSFMDDHASALEAAAFIVTGALLGTIEILDVEALS